MTQRIEIDGFRIYVLHILAELDPQAADNVDAVIYGHSHQPKIEDKERHTLFQSGQCRAAPLPPTHHCRPHDRRAWQVARRNR
jgi:predicted phosphodiesterase